MKTATVTQISYAESWTNQQGTTLHTFNVELDDGTAGQVNAKTSPPWYEVGTLVAYQVTHQEGRQAMRLRFQKPEYADRKQAPPPPPPQPAAGSADEVARWAIDAGLAFIHARSAGQSSPVSGCSLADVKTAARSMLALAAELKTEAKP